MNIMTQAQLIKQYNDTHREPFNEELFIRNEDDIIDEIKKVILSCEREQSFVIKVDSFRIVDNYEEIINILYKQEELGLKNKNKKKVNVYDYVNLKDTDIKLLIVRYYIEAKERQEFVDVLIIVPRIVEKYYFRIYGNLYSAMYQIVDASTYNNATSNSKKQSITLKTMFMPIRIYRNMATLTTFDRKEVKITHYTSRIFNKSFGVFKYILGRYGLYDTFSFTGINCISILDKNPNNDDMYVFDKYDMFICVPKYIFDNDPVTQALVFNIYHSINKDTKYNEVFTKEFWLKSLGGEFNTFTVDKGISILNSLESIYDISTRESIHLPEDDKKDIYSILRWMIREFPHLRIKDNLDISTKKVRYAPYIASLYAMKLAQGIYRLSDQGNRVTIESIKKVIMIKPTHLIDAICKCKLINYRNLVNDLDALTVLKYTYKGISGIGENNNNSIPDVYRTIDVSHLGRVDIDSSPKSDPGISGTLCPLTTLYDNSFSEFEEPNFWEVQFSELMNNYKKLVGMKEVITFKKEILGDTSLQEQEASINISIDNMKKLINPIKIIEDSAEYNRVRFALENGGNIWYGKE